MKKLLILSLWLLGFCLQANATRDTIVVEPYMQLVYDAFFKKLELKTDVPFCGEIKNFKFEWGYTWVLVVDVKKIANPMQDASNVECKLVKVLSKVPVDDDYEFQLRLESEMYLGPGEQTNTFVKLSEGKYEYFENIIIEVPLSLIEDFEQIFNSGLSRSGVFKFSGKNSITLVSLL
jgi:hypothetical protein